MPGLKAVVYVTGPDGTVRLGPGDEIPDWALAEITNPDCWDGDPPSVEAAASTSTTNMAAPGKSRSQISVWR